MCEFMQNYIIDTCYFCFEQIKVEHNCLSFYAIISMMMHGFNSRIGSN